MIMMHNSLLYTGKHCVVVILYCGMKIYACNDALCVLQPNLLCFGSYPLNGPNT